MGLTHRVESLTQRGLEVADAAGGLHNEHAALDCGQHGGGPGIDVGVRVDLAGVFQGLDPCG